MTRQAKRTIRSFVKREGRMTAGQQAALQENWHRYGINVSEPEQIKILCSQSMKHIVLDIGIGNGEALVEQALKEPEKQFIGVEVHRPGLGHCIQRMLAENIDNIKLVNDDVMLLFAQLPSNTIDTVQLYFPDPWPKKRHHKRRLLALEFLKVLVRVCKPGAILHMATDWEDYANESMALLSSHPSFHNTMVNAAFAERPQWRPITKFERRGLNLGHQVFDLIFTVNPTHD